jgi:cadherin 5 type 2 (VE-cadherin)
VKYINNEMVHFVGPSSPIIEDLKPMPNGLNISWKSDVTTRQDKFEVTYNRNDTGKLTLI